MAETPKQDKKCIKELKKLRMILLVKAENAKRPFVYIHYETIE